VPRLFVHDKKEVHMETEIVALTTGYILLRVGLLDGIGYTMYAVLRRRDLCAARPVWVRAGS
jgi:hypothetical protein